MNKYTNLPENIKTQRSKIRKEVREARNKLTAVEQKTASEQLYINFIQHINPPKNAQIGAYLGNDGELDTSILIHKLTNENHTIYLPIIHPFCKRSLLFQKHEKNSPMKANRYGIFEPKLNCSHIGPLYKLDYLLMPLVAFDESGNRLGMGGGYYDKTLANYHRDNRKKPTLIGLAHDCQKVPKVPTAQWDIPLSHILTPTHFYCG